jgi:hypothetical protein
METLFMLYLLLYLLCFLVAASVMVLVFAWNVLKLVLKLVRWILLWATRANDVEELGARLDARHAEWMRKRIASGQPVTWGGILKLLGRRMWTAYRHPIRVWRGEFDPPNKDARSAGGHSL